MEKFIRQHGVHRCLVFQITTKREIQRERETNYRQINYTTSPNTFCGKQSVRGFRGESYGNEKDKQDASCTFQLCKNRNVKTMSVSFTQELLWMFMARHT